ncbi:tryptophan-rich sensory protein [Alkalihalobacillus trypoxylicola]|uniref:Tryptophan-rich sensory protein n=1 Tax=Alkalihalobacillus trypoxylicola TaxID=519424 RepID=A0A162D0M7_9BACI|nr:tryptophan-rich sensory protein [Alkalihalobacillus trypoxylicola]KYG27615.1 hypothetical protein AZF04_10500 [Alkalihalobacillus trypoxylicola]
MKKLSFLFLLFFILMVAVNYGTSGQVSTVANAGASVIQPAGYTFSIWGAIYLLVFAWIIRGFFIQSSLYEQLKILVPLNFILNALWVITFSREYVILSVIIIFGLLVTLILIFRIIHASPDAKGFDYVPFSLYFGWVTVASIVNIFTAFLQYDQTEFLGLSEMTWAVIVIIVATLLTIFITWSFKDVVYGLAVIWAFIGIIVQTDSSLLTIVLTVAIALIAIVWLIVVWQKLRNHHSL